MTKFIRHVGRTTQNNKQADKQHTHAHTHTHTQNSQSVSNLTCNTDTGTMFKNLTLQDTNAVSSSTLDMFSIGPDIIAAIYTSFIQQNCGRLQDDDDGCWRRR